MPRKLKTTETFIKEVKEKYGDKWILDKVEYKGRHEKVEIGCKKHGYFLIRPNHLLSGIGCPICNSKTTEEFIEELKDLYVYEDDNLLFDKLEYINAKTEVEIGCKKHGYFKKTPKDLLQKKRIKSTCCPKCPNKTTKQFITEVKDKFGDRWLLDRVNYTGALEKVEIGCKKHGYWEVAPSNFLRGTGCPICISSKGERIIETFLLKNNIDFVREKTFDTCKNIRNLPFDFYIPSRNTLIEYNGLQHYRPVKWFGGKQTLKDIINRDNIKTQWCKDKNIKLLIITYNDNIEECLARFLIV